MTTGAAASLPDGSYEIPVTLSGGSGRAQVTSPAEVTVSDGAASAVIEWSSPYYDYMVVEGQQYYPVNTEGNSEFEIPVELDTAFPVQADTTAMSEAHLIDYTLTFDTSGITAARTARGQTGLVAALVIAVLAVIVIAVKAKAARKRLRMNRDQG